MAQAKTLFDFEVSYRLPWGVVLAVGANNAFNTFPDEHQKDANRSSNRFVYSRRVSQIGTLGGFYYLRMVVTL